MADVVSITGTATKVSDSRGGWNFALDVSETLVSDTGALSFPITNGGGTAVVPVSLITPGDLIVLKTPTVITVTAAFSGGGSMTNVPCRGLMVLQTEGLTSLTLTNDEAADVLVSVAVSKRST